MKNRLVVFLPLLLIAFSWLLAQLFTLQVIQGKYYLALSEENRIKLERTAAPRGIIYDRQGRPLVYNLAIEGKVPLSRDYLYGEVFAHVIGYVDADYLGKAGLEKEQDTLLAGQPGGQLFEVDTQGKKIRLIKSQQPIPGGNLYLNIDLNLQKAAHEALNGQKGAIVVSEPQTGAILALVSQPAYDPKNVEMFLDAAEQPLFNRAINGVYPPGSVFKIVTATAGLESGKINRQTTILDTGEIRIGEYRYGNWYFDRTGRTEGDLDVIKALKRSNDIFFYKVGELVGAKTLADWAKAFGLGQGIGFLPDLESERWFLGNTYHLAIGQGKIGVSPLQINLMTNVIANNGKLCPAKILKNDQRSCQDLGLHPETIELIREGMKEACQPGGTSLRFLDLGITVACKTGTAEFGDPQERTHAWFTVFVLPDEAPPMAGAKSGVRQITITVLVEAGGDGSVIAAPIAKKVLEEWINLTNQE